VGTEGREGAGGYGGGNVVRFPGSRRSPEADELGPGAVERDVADAGDRDAPEAGVSADAFWSGEAAIPEPVPAPRVCPPVPADQLAPATSAAGEPGGGAEAFWYAGGGPFVPLGSAASESAPPAVGRPAEPTASLSPSPARWVWRIGGGFPRRGRLRAAAGCAVVLFLSLFISLVGRGPGVRTHAQADTSRLHASAPAVDGSGSDVSPLTGAVLRAAERQWARSQRRARPRAHARHAKEPDRGAAREPDRGAARSSEPSSGRSGGTTTTSGGQTAGYTLVSSTSSSYAPAPPGSASAGTTSPRTAADTAAPQSSQPSGPTAVGSAVGCNPKCQ
jgi:hypothetical protein